jgi:hypothetical protein
VSSLTRRARSSRASAKASVTAAASSPSKPKPDAENKKFWDSSPTGELRLGTINPEAWQAFEIDGEYYIDFTPAD